MVAVVVTANGEERALARLLARLLPTGLTSDLSVIVVAYGGTDNALEIAAGFGRRVQAVAIPDAPKLLAIRTGDAVASGFPRIYLDAGVEIDGRGVRALAARAAEPGVLAVGPERVLDLTGCGAAVRCYYCVWSRLPEVRRGLFGRGALALSEAGHRRLAGLPALLAGDLGASLPFAPAERRIAADAKVTMRPPDNLAGLLQARAEVAAGARSWQPGPVPTAVARLPIGDVLGLVRADPGMLPLLPAFLAVSAVARLLALRGSAGAGLGRAG